MNVMKALPVCFVAGTLVLSPDGYLPIEEVEKGDLVLSKDEVSGDVEYKEVIRTFETPEQYVFRLVLKGENGEREDFKVTGEHPFWKKEEGFVPARLLKEGDEVFSLHGGWLKVSSGTWTRSTETVYNFEVDDFHTYLVGESGVWVHNNPCAQLGTLSQASKYGVQTYNAMKGVLKGTGLQAHHLIEKRFARLLGMTKGQMKSIAVTASEHQFFTNSWRNLIPYGYGTRTAGEEVVMNAARQIYAAYPEYLKALGL